MHGCPRWTAARSSTSSATRWRRPASIWNITSYSDTASGKRDDRPGLEACIKALRHGDTLVVWKLDRLGRDLRHLVNLVGELIVERTKAGLAAARARGRSGGRPFKMTPAKLREDGRRLIDLRKRRQPAWEPTNT